MCKHRSLGWFLIEINTIFFFLETYGLIWQHTQLGNSISTRPGTTNGRPSCFTLQLCKQVLSRRKDYKTMGLAQCRQWGVWEARRRTPALPLILPLWGHEKTDRAPRHHSLCLPNKDSPVFLTSAEGWGQWGQIWKGFEDRVWINLDIGRSF